MSAGISARFVHVSPSLCEAHTMAGSRAFKPVEQLTLMKIPSRNTFHRQPVLLPAGVIGLAVHVRPPSVDLHRILDCRTYTAPSGPTSTCVPCGFMSSLCGNNAFSTGTSVTLPRAAHRMY